MMQFKRCNCNDICSNMVIGHGCHTQKTGIAIVQGYYHITSLEKKVIVIIDTIRSLSAAQNMDYFWYFLLVRKKKKKKNFKNSNLNNHQHIFI